MNKLFLIPALLLSVPVSAQFTLSGKLSGATSGVMHLYYTDTSGKRTLDSCVLQDGEFHFKGLIAEPTMAILSYSQRQSAEIFIEPGTMSVSGDFKNIHLTGSASEKEFEDLNRRFAPILEEKRPMDSAYQAFNEVYIKAKHDKAPEAVLDSMKELGAKMHEAFTPFYDRIHAVTLEFFVAHPQSYVTATELGFYAESLPLDSSEMFYQRLGPVVQNGVAGRNVAKVIRKLKAGSPGSIAADFAATDMEGKPLHLADFRGKYVLLDFWASWCVPCRHGNPHLRTVYGKYHSGGLEIIGISDDDNNLPAWKKAVDKDSVGIWYHVLRGLDMAKAMKGEDNPNDINEKYGIHSLPTKILIDPQGKIVGRYDDAQEPLDEKLLAIFGK